MKGNDKSLSIEVLNHTALEREDFIDDNVNELGSIVHYYLLLAAFRYQDMVH